MTKTQQTQSALPVMNHKTFTKINHGCIILNSSFSLTFVPTVKNTITTNLQLLLNHAYNNNQSAKKWLLVNLFCTVIFHIHEQEFVSKKKKKVCQQSCKVHALLVFWVQPPGIWVFGWGFSEIGCPESLRGSDLPKTQSEVHLSTTVSWLKRLIHTYIYKHKN